MEVNKMKTIDLSGSGLTFPNDGDGSIVNPALCCIFGAGCETNTPPPCNCNSFVPVSCEGCQGFVPVIGKKSLKNALQSNNGGRAPANRSSTATFLVFLALLVP